MSIKDVRHELQRLADRSVIKEHRIVPLTIQTVLEAGQQKVLEAYYGKHLETNLNTLSSQDHDIKEKMMVRLEALVPDLERTRKGLREMHTTSDFPLAVAQARDAASRQGYQYPDSDLPTFARRRTATDFKRLKATRDGIINHRFLPVRAESTNVQFTSYGSSEEGYSVASHELALDLTWETWLNDDLGDFAAAATSLGNVARRTRAMVIIDVILRKAVRIPLTDGEFGPTVENLDQIAQYFSTREDADGKRRARRVTDLFVPGMWERKAVASMDGERRIATGGASGPLTLTSDRNPVYQLANVHPEDIIAELLDEFPERYAGRNISDNDYIVLDGRNLPIELATLRGYEGGPKVFTLRPDVLETEDEGSWGNHTIAVKVVDHCAADIVDEFAVAIAQGN